MKKSFSLSSILLKNIDRGSSTIPTKTTRKYLHRFSIN